MELGAILSRTDLTWFTELVHWDRLCRYVVGLTNNTERSLQLLQNQIESFQSSFDNLTFGWRTDPQGVVFIDVGTSTDSLTEARQLQSRYDQQAIWDIQNQEEIF